MPSINFDSLSGSSKLFLDFICCSDTAFKYFKYDFKSVSSYINAAEWIDKSSYQREKIAGIIKNAASSLNFPSPITKNIKKLAEPDSLVVFSGQQVGLILGPMYTVIKALTTYKLAKKLENMLNRPVVPCFWMATDDHDFEEIKTVRLLDRAGKTVEAAYNPATMPDDFPMADVLLGNGLEEFLSNINDNLIETEFTPGIKKIISNRYQNGFSISSGFAGVFSDLLGEFGIVPVDPNYPGMKEIFAPIFEQEIENHKEIFEQFELSSQELINAGYHRQVHKAKDSLNLFYNENGRANIVFENKKFKLQGRDAQFTKEQLLEELKSSPEKFSPNVCLRPIAQCFAFPTICQVVGPSEAAYFAQIRPIFKHMNVPWPVIKPRMFATLIEPHIKKIIDKLGIDFSSLYNDTDHEISRVIKENFPSEIQDNADSIRKSIEKPLIELAESLKNKDPESRQVLEHSRKRVDHELNHLFKRLFTTHKKRHDTAIGQIQKAANFLFPQGKFQERVISPIYFANKFGPDIFKRLEDELDIDAVDHQIFET